MPGLGSHRKIVKIKLKLDLLTFIKRVKKYKWNPKVEEILMLKSFFLCYID